MIDKKDEEIRRLRARITELEGKGPIARDLQSDMMKLADAFFENLERDNCEYGGWGLNSKRPFGNSDVEDDILEIIGHQSEFDCLVEGAIWSAKNYANYLYDGLGEFLRREWTEFRSGPRS